MRRRAKRSSGSRRCPAAAALAKLAARHRAGTHDYRARATRAKHSRRLDDPREEEEEKNVYVEMDGAKVRTMREGRGFNGAAFARSERLAQDAAQGGAQPGSGA